MGGLAGLAGMILKGVETVSNTIEGRRLADELNKKHEQGYGDLQKLGPRVTGDLTGIAREAEGKLKGSALGGADLRLGNQAQLARALFGVDLGDQSPLTPEEVLKDPLAADRKLKGQSGAGMAKSAVSNMKLGQGGVTGATREAGAKTMADLQTKLDADSGQMNAELDALETTARHDFDNIKMVATQGTQEVQAFIQDRLGAFEKGAAGALDSIRDMAGRMAAGIAQPALSAMSQEVAQLSARKTGDPATDAVIDREIRALKDGYTSQAKDAISSSNIEMRNFTATMHKDISAQRVSISNQSMETLRQSNADAYTAVNNGFATWADLAKTSKNIKADRYNVEAGIYGDVLKSVFTAETGALALDAELMSGISNMVDGTISQATSDMIAIDSSISQMLANAVLSGANIESSAAMALINAFAEFVPLDLGGSDLVAYGIKRQELDLEQQRINAANRAANLGFAGSIIGAGADVGSAGFLANGGAGGSGSGGGGQFGDASSVGPART